MAFAWGAFLAAIAIGVGFYLNKGPEAPPQEGQAKLGTQVPRTPAIARVQNPAILPDKQPGSKAATPGEEPKGPEVAPPGGPIKIQAMYLANGLIGGAALNGKIFQVTDAVVQGTMQRGDKALVVIAAPGRTFSANDVGGRISCYGTPEALRINEIKPGQAISVGGKYIGRVSATNGFDETEAGNANLIECETTFLGPTPQQPIQEAAVQTPQVQLPTPREGQIPKQSGPKLLRVPDEVTFQRKQQALWALPEYHKKFFSINPDDWLSLSGEIYDLARNEPDTNARFCEYRIAIELAMRGGNFRLAYGYAKDLTGLYQVDPIAIKRPIIDAAMGPAVHEAVLLALQLAEEAQALDQVDQMKELLLLAESCAKPPELVRSVKDISDYLNSLVILATQPDDPDANLIVGKFLWFQRHDWDNGTQRLLKCNEPLLKSLAAMESMRPTDPNQQFALGEHWWNSQGDVGEPWRSIFNARALEWYRTAMPRLGKDSLAYKTAKSRIEVPVDEPPPKPKTTMQRKVESFLADFNEMMADSNKQETTLQKEKRHDDLMAEIDRRISNQMWVLHCRIIDVQEAKKGTETGYKFTVAPADELPTGLSGDWIVRQSATLTVDQVKALRANPGDYLTFSGNPRLTYTQSAVGQTRNGVSRTLPLVQSDSDYLMHRDDVGDKTGTHVLSFPKASFTLQKMGAKSN